MAAHTQMTVASMSQVARAFGLGRCHALEAVPEAGFLNSSYRFFTEKGGYFLRIYEYLNEEGVHFEKALVRHLGNRGAAVPRLLADPNETFRVDGKACAVFDLIPGLSLIRDEVTLDNMVRLGMAIAKCHLAGKSFKKRRPLGAGLASLNREMRKVQDDDYPHLLEDIALLREKGVGLQALRPAHLPKGVVHGDLFPDNVVWTEKNTPVLLDWELAGDGDLLEDLLLAVLAWTFEETFDWDLARAMVGAYHEIRPLEAIERTSLRIMFLNAAIRLALIRMTFMQIKIDPQETPYRDYRRFLARLNILEGMDQETFERLLL